MTWDSSRTVVVQVGNGSHWSSVGTLPVAPLWCDLGFFPNSRGIKAAANLRPNKAAANPRPSGGVDMYTNISSCIDSQLTVMPSRFAPAAAQHERLPAAYPARDLAGGRQFERPGRLAAGSELVWPAYSGSASAACSALSLPVTAPGESEPFQASSC